MLNGKTGLNEPDRTLGELASLVTPKLVTISVQTES